MALHHCASTNGAVGASAAAVKDEASLRFDDYISDVVDWIKLMNEGGKFKNIVLLGHSEGALDWDVGLPSRT
jgi:hypothetical protein